MRTRRQMDEAAEDVSRNFGHLVIESSREIYTAITCGWYDFGWLFEQGGIVNTRVSRTAQRPAVNDVGTLWSMRRHDCQARCALIAWPSDWELRILVDGEILLAERCPRGAEAFAIAERWRNRMLGRGWQQVTPRSPRQRAREQGETGETSTSLQTR